MGENKYVKPPVTPPPWADRFLEWYCNPDLLDEVQGDLYEAFYHRVKTRGIHRAKLLFIKEVLLFCKPSSFPKGSSFNPLISKSMFQNYLKIAFRNLLKSKAFSIINLFGLAIGLTACFLILQYVRFELSYDQFHEKADHIYRVTIDSDREPSATNHPGAGPALKADFPEIVDYARAVHQSIFMGTTAAWSYTTDQGETKVFNEDQVYDVDPSFLTMFSFPFVHGDPETALSDITSVVISESVSKKFFGSTNPMGKTLVLNGHSSFTVTGVFQDLPENSHIKFDILLSIFMKSRLGGDFRDQDEGYWKWAEFYTYIQLDSLSNPKHLENKLPEFVARYLGDRMEELNTEYLFNLQPITDIHLRSPKLEKEREIHGSESTVYFLIVIALLILTIAWINYINLSTSKSLERAQEIGLRKVAGASRLQLIIQFLFEAAILNALSILLSILLIIAASPFFNQLTGKNFSNNVLDILPIAEPWFWLMIAAALVLGSLLAGLYPAFVLSSFRVASVVKGKYYRSKSGIILRKALVGSQFLVSLALIAGTIIVFNQVTYMRNQDLGYTKDQLLVVKSPIVGDSTMASKVKSFTIELARDSQINGIAPSSEIPGRMIAMQNFIRNRNEGPESNLLSYHFHIDTNFLKTYEIELAAGRNFRNSEYLFPLERENPIPVMLNERAAESLGYQHAEKAVNQLLLFGLGTRDWLGEIVGVLKNHHQRSLKNGYDPILYFPASGFSGAYLTVSMSMNMPHETIAFIEKHYREAFPGNEFEYFFLDDYFDRQYAADQQFGKVFGLFTTLALVVACLGLFGLTTFMISQRVKEIAVRKVLGATISNMIYLFSRDSVKLILITNLIALPLVYVGAQKWLNNFAFQVNISWWWFVAPGTILLVISLATTGFQTIRTGFINPVNSLRQE